MRISDWSSDVCSSDLVMTDTVEEVTLGGEDHAPELIDDLVDSYEVETQGFLQKEAENVHKLIKAARDSANSRSEEHTSELQSLMRISYAVFCLKKKKIKQHRQTYDTETEHDQSTTR